jgi:hypothetical protein
MISSNNIRLNIIHLNIACCVKINVNDFSIGTITENDDLNFHGFHARAWQLLLNA